MDSLVPGAWSIYLLRGIKSSEAAWDQERAPFPKMCCKAYTVQYFRNKHRNFKLILKLYFLKIF